MSNDGQSSDMRLGSVASAWAAYDSAGELGPMTIERRAVGAKDVLIEIGFCGICHSDVHSARNDWGRTVYPIVPGHEIVGRVSDLGVEVANFGVGDLVGVGCMVDSCGECPTCQSGLEQYCTVGPTFTYNSLDRRSGGRTFGGYSSHIVVDERFVLRIPESLAPARAAPLLCAGITSYSPLKLYGVGLTSRVAVAGFGGLGGMALKLAKALGANTTVITRSDSKVAQALATGADEAIKIGDQTALDNVFKSFDLILSTIPVDHDLMPYLRLLKRDGTLVILGALEPLRSPIDGMFLAANRIRITSSMMGGIGETQELLDLCAAKGISTDVEVVPIGEVNRIHSQLARGDSDVRYVISSNA